jgi:hypothetical protein
MKTYNQSANHISTEDLEQAAALALSLASSLTSLKTLAEKTGKLPVFSFRMGNALKSLQDFSNYAAEACKNHLLSVATPEVSDNGGYLQFLQQLASNLAHPWASAKEKFAANEALLSEVPQEYTERFTYELSIIDLNVDSSSVLTCQKMLELVERLIARNTGGI